MNCLRKNKWLYNLLLLFTGLNMTTASNRFANEGEALQLNCPYNKVNSWQLDANEFLALCEHDKPMLNNDSYITHRMNISSDCTILTITNFTKEDFGTYVCFVTQKDKDNTDVYVKHEIYVTLRKLQIDEATGANFVQGTEGKNMSLTCSLQGGSSNDILYWIKDNRTLKSGKPPSLKYTFMADQSDNMKEFKCRGSIMKISYFLKKKVTVKLYLKPTVFITVLSNSNVAEIDRNVIVRQGQHIELKCSEKYNTSGDVVIFSWLFNNIFLKNNTNMLVVNSANPEQSGEYICRAHNRAGRYDDAINITVADRPEMPQHFQVVALKREIIVKWRAGNSGGMLQTFIVEYRNRFESEWSVITARGNTSDVIDGLQMGTVYFVRMFSRNILGESNITDESIIKTVAGNHHLVIQNCSWEIGVISSAAVVVFFLCLCRIKATPERNCLNMTRNRSNTSQSNETIPETHVAQYSEIDSVYYNPNINDRPETSFDSTQHETSLISVNYRGIENITADNVRTGSFNQEIIQSETDSNIIRVDNVSTSSSSDDSYLVPSRNYINLEIGFTDEHSHQIRERENLGDSLSASNSESSETHIESDHKYEKLASASIDEHSYATTTETY